MFSFKREGNRDLYVSELAIRNGKDENQVISSLVEAGYSVVNKDMNETAAGDHIYIGCKYTDDPDNAITDVMTIHTKNKYGSYSVTDERHVYSLVADVDLNKGAGGDYIYLLQTRDRQDSGLVASMIGEGSVLIIITFAAVSACIIEGIYIMKQKRQYKENSNTGGQSNSGE
jgi:hypothetical protein